MFLVVQYHFSACVILSLPTGVHSLSTTSFLCGRHPFFVNNILSPRHPSIACLLFGWPLCPKLSPFLSGWHLSLRIFSNLSPPPFLNRQIKTRRIGRESAVLVWTSGTQETTWYLFRHVDRCIFHFKIKFGHSIWQMTLIRCRGLLFAPMTSFFAAPSSSLATPFGTSHQSAVEVSFFAPMTSLFCCP